MTGGSISIDHNSQSIRMVSITNSLVARCHKASYSLQIIKFEENEIEQEQWRKFSTESFGENSANNFVSVLSSSEPSF